MPNEVAQISVPFEGHYRFVLEDRGQVSVRLEKAPVFIDDLSYRRQIFVESRCKWDSLVVVGCLVYQKGLSGHGVCFCHLGFGIRLRVAPVIEF